MSGWTTIGKPADVLEVDPGVRIVSARTPARVALYLESGELTLHAQHRLHRPGPLLLAIKEPVLLGAIEAISGGLWPYSIFARSRCRLLRLTRSQMLAAAASPSSGTLFWEIRLLTEQLLSTLQHLNGEDVPTRMLQLFWTLGRPSETPGEFFTAQVSQAQVARFLGVSVRTVARHMRRLETDGLIRTSRGRVSILEDRRSENRGQGHRRTMSLWQFRRQTLPRREDPQPSSALNASAPATGHPR